MFIDNHPHFLISPSTELSSSTPSTKRDNPPSFYEVWYCRIPLPPDSNESLWLRLTTLSPLQSQPSICEAWGIWTTRDATQPRWVCKNTFSLFEKFQFHSNQSLQIGPCVLGPTFFRGALQNQRGEMLEWDLSIKGESPTWFHVSPLLQKLKATSSQVCTPLPKIQLSGAIQLNGSTLKLQSVESHQGHIWGRRYAHNWAWAHGLNFRDSSGGQRSTRLEILTARVPIISPRVVTPPITALFFEHNHQLFRWRGLQDQFRLSSNATPTHWKFTATGPEGLSLEGEVDASASTLIGVTYTDPSDEKLYCYNTGFADCQVTVKLPGQNIMKLRSRDTAFETCSRQKLSSHEVFL